MKKMKCILFLTTFLTFHLISFCQETFRKPLRRCPVKVINFDQGLLNNETTGVITDASGFTWVSTRSGLQRFNGYTLDNINPVIGHDIVRITTPVYLFALRNGNIWISYKNGILSYNPVTNLFKKEIILSSSANLFFSIVPLIETSEGIWCMQSGKGITIYNPSQKRNTVLNNVDMDDVINSDDLINSSIIAINKKYIIIRVNSHRLLQINTDSHKFSYINSMDEIIGLGCDKNNLYTVTNSQLSSINIAKGNVVKKYSIQKLLKNILQYSCVQPEDKNKLLVSLNGFLYEFDNNLSNIHQLSTLNEDPVLPSGLVHHIYVDAFKKIWVLTNNDLRIIQNINIPFEHFIYKRLESNLVRSIYFDSVSRNILAGCASVEDKPNGGVRVFDTFGNPRFENPILTNEIRDIGNITKIDEGNYLVVTTDKLPWYLLNLSKKRFKKLKLPPNSPSDSSLFNTVWPNNLQRVNDSTIFIASAINIFSCIFKHEELKSIKPLLPFDGNSTNIISCFIYTSDKNIWAGSNSGIIYRIQQNGTLQTLSIPGNYLIRCFAEDDFHNVWVGTDKGIYVYNNSGKPIKSVDIQSGLLNDYIYAILPIDKTTSVFCSTKLGISYVPLSGPIKCYTRELGLQENEFNTESAIKTPSGKFYFGGINGITAFYPSDLKEINDAPVLNITQLIVNDSNYDFSPAVWHNDSITLNYTQNHLQFDIAALGLLYSDEYNYQYRLKGFDQTWQITHQPTHIKYVLPPGDYLLEIRCSPIFSSSRIFRKYVRIIILPPWWQTWWSRTLFIAFLIAFVVLIVQQYLKRRYQKELRALQLQNEIQNERNRISRDLHDNIGAQLSFISSNIDWVIDKELNKEDELKQMKAINETAKNVMGNLRETIWALHKDQITVQEFSDKLKAYVQNIMQLQSGLEFQSEEIISNNFVLTPIELLNIFRICQECVNNVIKHANATLLKLTIRSDEKIFHIQIEDDGVGFNLRKIPEDHYGLKNMRHRAGELKAKLLIRSGEGKGTIVEIQK